VQCALAGGGARFIGVLQVRDGKILGWREYQNTAAITAALSET
jgi:limonene-1,2-epoxide hydrolase